MTRFVKRGLLHTSNSINLEDHTLVIKTHTKLKLPPAIKHYWSFLYSCCLRCKQHTEYQKLLFNCRQYHRIVTLPWCSTDHLKVQTIATEVSAWLQVIDESYTYNTCSRLHKMSPLGLDMIFQF